MANEETHLIIAENLFCSVFGHKAYRGMASAFKDEVYFKKEVQKLIQKLAKSASELIASEQFLESITYQLRYIKKRSSAINLDIEGKELLLINLKAIATLLGFHPLSGPTREEPYFIPSVWVEKQGWMDFLKYMDEKENLEKSRKNLVKNLKDEGYTYAEIAFIMNLSNYRVAQIIKEVNIAE